MALNKAAITNGVIGPGDMLVKPVSPAAMQVAISMGTLHKDGHTVVMDADTTVDITANTSGYNRIDAIVIEVDDATNTTTAKAIAGTPSSSPARPTITSKQEVLAYVTVGNNASVINANAISDARKQAATRLATNPNLLINGGFDVWQELESYTLSGGSVVGYCADQWHTWSSGANTGGNALITRSDAGLRMQHNGYTGYTFIAQTVDEIILPKLIGKTVTLSFEATIGQGGYLNGVLWDAKKFGKYGASDTGTGLADVRITGDGTRRVYSVSGVVPEDITDLDVVFTSPNNQATHDYTLHWAKLEVGGAATPYVPEDYTLELLRCMRYYWRPETYLYTHFIPADRDQWYLLVGLVFPVRMRVAPTTTIYEPHNVFLAEPDHGGYKFGAEDWGAPDHIWPRGDSDRTNYERLKSWGVRTDGLTELLIEDFGNPDPPPDNDRWAYYFHAEFDARRRS